MIYPSIGDHPPLDMVFLVKIPISENTICLRKHLNTLNLSNFDFELTDDFKLWLFQNIGRPYEKWVVMHPFGGELKIWFREEPDAVLCKLTWG